MKIFLVFCVFALIGSCFTENNQTDEKENAISLTTIQPSPEPIHSSDNLHFELNMNNVTCAIFNFTATIKISNYFKNGSLIDENIINLLKSTELDLNASFCDQNKTALNLFINGEKSEELNLQLMHESSNYYMNYINFSEKNETFLSVDQRFKVNDDKSFLCLADQEIILSPGDKESLKKVTLKLEKVQIDAFRKTTDNVFRQAEQCEMDYPPNDFVPLAVGSALIALVFIVLIAYIVGRKRSKQLTYQSV